MHRTLRHVIQILSSCSLPYQNYANISSPPYNVYRSHPILALLILCLLHWRKVSLKRVIGQSLGLYIYRTTPTRKIHIIICMCPSRIPGSSPPISEQLKTAHAWERAATYWAFDLITRTASSRNPGNCHR
jgi:hypothetical protein